jgi:Fur family peroxide stress response transcriptional regulator
MKTTGFKHSKKREAILGLLQSTRSHPTASWIYENLKGCIPDLSLGTVYRNISVLRMQGLVRSLGVVEGEERFDGFALPHPHIVCSVCGAVSDVPQEETDSLCRFVETSGLTCVDPLCTVFYGICECCVSRESLLTKN